ncbi:MAG: hypothetical protein EZS28_010984 [Streblomastix strix]|uniref:Reverse transcriptase domain-containing protein n=1 Tax=Streblomastix strix TaxID=222440 RepID=A0A5J4WF54_9EUKA|nr:MAG: hypothetical protein EZS28_010984 [Streblomastix strix]
MEIDMESEGHDINPSPLEAKINQASFHRQRYNLATKSYLLRYISILGTGLHHPGYGEGQIEVQEVILRYASGETISITEWRKILDASILNEEIQSLHFQMSGVDQVRYLLIPNDWAVTLDLKSAFHHLIVYPPHRAYLAFEIDNHHYQNKAMPFGWKHSPIFFTQVLIFLLTEIRKRTDTRIINYSDDLFLLHQDKNCFFFQTQYIINIQDQFGWTITLSKCQLAPKQDIDLLGWI